VERIGHIDVPVRVPSQTGAIADIRYVNLPPDAPNQTRPGQAVSANLKLPAPSA
jgi:hypothetical protein